MPHTFLSRLVRRMALAMTFVLLTLGVITPGHAADTMIKVTDLAGRTVTVKKGVQRAILGEGRLFYATVVLNKAKPFAQLAAIGDDVPKFDPDTWNQYLANVPDAKNVPLVSALASGDFSVEKAIALDADLIVLSLGFYDKAKETGILDNLEKAGIPTIFIDFRERPTQNAVPSMLLLGRVFDRQDQAQEFVDFYTQQMRRIYNVTNQLKQNERPLIFAEQAAGLEPDTCCRSFGNFNFGEFVSEAGGMNWGSKFFSGASGMVNPEKIIVEDPAYLLMTGANWSKSNPGNKAVWLGYEAQPEKVQEQIRGLVQRPGIAQLSTVKNKKVMAIYHQFYQSPYHFVAIQALAKWIHPDKFKDLDPQATYQELHDKFLAVPLNGLFWAELK
ncbi:ABC transporter substrate-binding protein [Microvirga sp. 2YAF29]|uniref:ABC transporter substrate-binding protein n=1 Tax=Microvirga sp. 2YAF29 TaxID=3233031 RepID=UPI003F9B14E4